MSSSFAESHVNDALSLARLGWLVIALHTVLPDRTCSCRSPACRSPGKHPMVAHGHHDGTTDELTIARWFQVMPSANIGAVTGPRSRIVVFDVDPRNGGEKTLADLTATYGPLPETVTARTGGGGLHFFFAWHEAYGSIPSRANVWPGIDIKCAGGYVAVAPSIHHSLERYSWLPHNVTGRAM